MKPLSEFISDDQRGFLIFDHRGKWTRGPENSLAAFEGTLQSGRIAIELDVQKSSDGVFFVMHDKTLTRMTGDRRTAQELDWSELQTLRLREGRGGCESSASDQIIPSLGQVFSAFRDRAYIDLDSKFPENLIDIMCYADACGVAEQCGVKGGLVDGFDTHEFRDILNKTGITAMPQIFFRNDKIAEQIESVLTVEPAAVQTKFDDIDTFDVVAQRLRELGIAVLYNSMDEIGLPGWTDQNFVVDPRDSFDHMRTHGLSMLLSDRADQIDFHLRENGIRRAGDHTKI